MNWLTGQKNKNKDKKVPSNYQVVVIEDDPEISYIIQSSLQMAGFEVHAADNGRAGLELVREVLPDAITLDIKIPKMNGYEVCAAIQTDAKLSGLPILVLTALLDDVGEEEEEEWRNRLGIADFIIKPFEPSNLVDRVQRAIENRRNEKQP